MFSNTMRLRQTKCRSQRFQRSFTPMSCNSKQVRVVRQIANRVTTGLTLYFPSNLTLEVQRESKNFNWDSPYLKTLTLQVTTFGDLLLGRRQGTLAELRQPDSNLVTQMRRQHPFIWRKGSYHQISSNPQLKITLNNFRMRTGPTKEI